MLRVGLTGGLGTGKSFVAEELARLGCYWIQADELGHRVLAPDGEAYGAVVKEFGSGILKEDGTIDRQTLAEEVFGQPERLAKLNSFVHPPVIALEEQIMRGYAARDPRGITVVEAAILVETGSYKRFDRLIVTHCRREQQFERAMRRRGASRRTVLARLDRQLPLEEKARVADYVIDTSGAKEDTIRQVREVYDSLRSIES